MSSEPDCSYLSFLPKNAGGWLEDYRNRRLAHNKRCICLKSLSLWNWINLKPGSGWKRGSGKTAETWSLIRNILMGSIFSVLQLHNCHPVLLLPPLLPTTSIYIHILLSRVASYTLSSNINISSSFMKFLPLKIPLILWIPLQISYSGFRISFWLHSVSQAFLYIFLLP